MACGLPALWVRPSGTDELNMVASTRTVLAVLATALLVLPADAQSKRKRDRDDMRDTIVLKSGKEVRGRVKQRHDEKELLVMQGGKRVRIRQKRVQSIDTVRDKLRQYFDQRVGHDPALAETHWELSKWCEKAQLWHLARVEAHAVLVRDPDHGPAHEFLGHKRKKRGYLWPLGSRFVSKDKFDEYTGDIGHALELRSEHFVIESDAGIERTVNALLDLERMYLWWLDEHGEALQLDEVLEPMRLRIYDEDGKFPQWSNAGHPYFVPNPYNEYSYLFYSRNEPRPTRLFEVATQHLLYRTLARNNDPGGEQQRFVDWFELGIAQYVDSKFFGDPGNVEPIQPAPGRQHAQLALQGKRYSLKNMLHLTLRDHFYGAGTLQRRTNRTRSDVHWAAVHMFVAFLLDEDANPNLGPKVFEYLRVALGEGKGDSSRVFDRAIGKPIEKFEKPWKRWLIKQAATPGRPR